MKTEDQQLFALDLTKNTCGEPWLFAAEMLQRVSRTFALNIQVLPRNRLRRPVLLAYLFCRMADTIEDCPSLSAAEKERLLDLFSAIFSEDASEWVKRTHEFKQAIPPSWVLSDDDEEFLCAHCDWTLALFFEFSLKVQRPVIQCIQEMCAGMGHFALRQEQSQGQWLTIENEADLDQYCYYVAGVVGNLLCDLFYQQSIWISKARYQHMKEYAVSFGLALQVVNITKDVLEDSERQVCFVPMEWIRREGFLQPHALFAPDAPLQNRSNVMKHMVRKAWTHLQDSMDFTLLIPVFEPRIRLFCLWPMMMAAETLVAVGDGQKLFDPKTKVKISRSAVKRILQKTTVQCWNRIWLQSRLSKLRLNSPA